MEILVIHKLPPVLFLAYWASDLHLLYFSCQIFNAIPSGPLQNTFFKTSLFCHQREVSTKLLVYFGIMTSYGNIFNACISRKRSACSVRTVVPVSWNTQEDASKAEDNKGRLVFSCKIGSNHVLSISLQSQIIAEGATHTWHDITVSLGSSASARRQKLAK